MMYNVGRDREVALLKCVNNPDPDNCADGCGWWVQWTEDNEADYDICPKCGGRVVVNVETYEDCRNGGDGPED